MRQQFLWLAIAASVLFNVFFAAGYFQAKAKASASQQTQETSVLNELKLNDEQAGRFKELQNDFREMSRLYQDGIALVQNELLTEFASGSPDADVIETLMQRDADLHRERRIASLERLRVFAETLSPDQSREFIRRMSERSDRHRRKQEMMLRRFDSDGDGTLSKDEEALARAAFEKERQRRREAMEENGRSPDRGRRGGRRDGRDGHRRPGSEMMMLRRFFDLNENGRMDPEEQAAVYTQFDANQDGWLDESERSEIGRWLRGRIQEQNEGDPAPPGGPRA